MCGEPDIQRTLTFFYVWKVTQISLRLNNFYATKNLTQELSRGFLFEFQLNSIKRFYLTFNLMLKQKKEYSVY